LFFDRSLSGPLLEGDNDGTNGSLGLEGEAGRVSCAGCHLPQANFVDTRSPHQQISLAAQWTRRRTPTLLEVGFVPLLNWDGRRDSVWSQAIGVFESDREFNSSRLFIARQVLATYGAEYSALFGAPPALDGAPSLTPENAGCVERRTATGIVLECHGKPGDGAEFDALPPETQADVTEVTVNVAKAIAAYVGDLRCGASRFDAWLDGDATAFTESEVRGARLFVGRGDCASCHSGPNLTDGQFHNVGLSPATVAVAFVDSNDRGAAEGIPLLAGDPLSTQGPFSDGVRDVVPAPSPEHEGAFRTPTLRCLLGQPSFFHTGQMRSLEQAVAFFDRGGDPAGYPGVNELRRLNLSADERADLVAFLVALEGAGPSAELLEQPQAPHRNRRRVGRDRRPRRSHGRAGRDHGRARGSVGRTRDDDGRTKRTGHWWPA
jgi:cytochrome c peroxidase